MRKLLVRLILLPILVVVAVFAIANREVVQLSLWPLPWEAEAPLFLVLLACLLLGVLIGAGLAWASGRDRRSAARHFRRDNERLQRQVAAMKVDALRAREEAAANLPAINVVPANDRITPPPSFTPINRRR